MEKRVSMLKWLSSTIGWNPFMNCVVPLGEAMKGDSPYKQEAGKASNLINLKVDGVNMIGVMVPAALGNSGVTRPSDRTSPLLPVIKALPACFRTLRKS